MPEFPLPEPEDAELAVREAAIWVEAWRTPQAAAWARESWRWTVVAEYCRLKAEVEKGAPAAFVAQLHRYRDQIGLTPAGLRENGWAIAAAEIERAAPAPAVDAAPAAPVRRLRA